MELVEIFRVLSRMKPLRAGFADRRLARRFHQPYGGCDHADQASFEAETQNQGFHREGAGCRRIEFFAAGWCIRINDAHGRYPAIRQYLA